MVMPVMPRVGEWTVDDLRDLPDDGLQYELADGVLLVTPAPKLRHQRVLLNLAFVLRERIPADLELFVAPVDFQPTRHRSLQPDVLVVRRAEVGEDNVTSGLVLAVRCCRRRRARRTWCSSARSTRTAASRRTGWWTPRSPACWCWSCRTAGTSRSPARSVRTRAR